MEQLYKEDRNKEVLFWPDMNVRNLTEADTKFVTKLPGGEVTTTEHNLRLLLLHVSTAFSC